MSKQAWYIGCFDHEIADRIILVGDPARVDRISDHLTNVTKVSDNRGLRTITGQFNDRRVSVVAYGMGAPIASIVLHELAELGSRIFLRIGTAIALPPVRLGEYVVADTALRREGTSTAYAPPDECAKANPEMIQAIVQSVAELGQSHRVGRFASFDGFYRDLFALDEDTSSAVKANFDDLESQGVLAADMETSALLTVGSVLGCKVGSLCVATVDSQDHKKLDELRLKQLEQDLFEMALSSVVRVS